MEQLVENEKKSGIKTFFIIIFFVVLIDFLIFVISRFNRSLPHLTTLLAIGLVVIACGYILIKYFSKYLYILDQEEIVFYIVIGKRKFEALRLGLEDLREIKAYNQAGGEKPDYRFVYDKKADNLYIGSFKIAGKVKRFLFSPNERILKELKRSENNG